MVGFHAGFKALPHSLVKLLKSLRVLIAVKEWRLNAGDPDFCANGFQIFAVVTEANSDVLIFLTVSRYQFRAAKSCELRCGDSKTTFRLTKKIILSKLISNKPRCQSFEWQCDHWRPSPEHVHTCGVSITQRCV